MQQEKHPPYGPVVFRDRAAGYAFLTRSTAVSEETIDWDDGHTYPVVDVEISSQSHPFYTGRARVIDSAGEIAKFERRYGRVTETARPAPRVTPDPDLHTGTEGDVSPEDLVLASGREMTPANLEWARRRLDEEGPAAIERELP